MNRVLLTALLVVALIAPIAPARTLERAEILEIFEHLTAQPRNTWISAGTIEALHIEYGAPKITDSSEVQARVAKAIQDYQADAHKPEVAEFLQKMRLDAIPFNTRYKLANEYTMETEVTVKCNGDRLRWQIDMISREDSVKPGPELEGNYLVERIDPEWHGKRLLVWDGEKHTNYSYSAGSATVKVDAGGPGRFRGPLTAGIIPWGFGRYTNEALLNRQASAVKEQVDGILQIRLTLIDTNGSQEQFVLDPEKDYAVKSHLFRAAAGPVVLKQLSDYELIGGLWTPRTILIDKHDLITDRLLASDLWSLQKIKTTTPRADEFEVAFEDNTTVEYFNPLSPRSLAYKANRRTDARALVAKKLEAQASTLPANCATLSIKHVASQYGLNVAEEQLSALVGQADGLTNLADMKRLLESSGLYCSAVKTDLAGLKQLQNTKAILYFSGKKHFVALDHITSDSVWTVDLSAKMILRDTDIAFFDMDWSDGTALLVSNEPISPNADISQIPDEELTAIAGGDGYTCTNLIQDYLVVYCTDIMGCDGYYEEYYERYGCEANTSGSCYNSIFLRKSEAQCLYNVEDDVCYAGDVTYYYMRACK